VKIKKYSTADYAHFSKDDYMAYVLPGLKFLIGILKGLLELYSSGQTVHYHFYIEIKPDS
jgi:hypothetical protein